MNIELHPVLAAAIARAVNDRTVAGEMIGTIVNRDADKYVHADYLHWRNEHIEATRRLAAFGIKLHTYVGNMTVEGLK